MHDFQETCYSNTKPMSPIYKSTTKGENERQAKRGWIINPSSRNYPCSKLAMYLGSTCFESGHFHQCHP